MALRVSARSDADGWLVVEVAGEVDAHSVDALRHCLDQHLRGGRGLIRVDLGGLTYADSSGLGVLLGAHNRAGRQGGSLELDRVPRAFRTTLTMTGLDTVLRIRSTAA